MGRLTNRNLIGLLGARTALAGFTRTAEREARAVGTTHAQHHVMLAVHAGADGASSGSGTTPDDVSVKDVASALGVAGPSAVELIARMVEAGLIDRHNDPLDGRLTRLRLTDRGRRLLHQLSATHLARLRTLHRVNLELLSE